MFCSRNMLDSYYIFPASSLGNEAFNNMHKKTADHEPAVFCYSYFPAFSMAILLYSSTHLSNCPDSVSCLITSLIIFSTSSFPF